MLPWALMAIFSGCLDGQTGKERPSAVVSAIVDACSGIADGALCNDQNACTTGDTCLGGLCVGSLAVDGTACTDGDQCTAGDACRAGLCKGNRVPEGSPCTDGDFCTEPDTCRQGLCVGGPAKICDDAIACTMDRCVAGRGCVFTPTMMCPDGAMDAATDGGLDGGVVGGADAADGSSALPESGVGEVDALAPEGGGQPTDAAPIVDGRDAQILDGSQAGEGGAGGSGQGGAPDAGASSPDGSLSDAGPDSSRPDGDGPLDSAGDPGSPMDSVDGGEAPADDAGTPDAASPEDGAMGDDGPLSDDGAVADDGATPVDAGEQDSNEDSKEDSGGAGGEPAGDAATGPAYEVRGGGCVCTVTGDQGSPSWPLAPASAAALAWVVGARRPRRRGHQVRGHS